ncbi:unnamed protein product [Chrysoparadoxa australica]
MVEAGSATDETGGEWPPSAQDGVCDLQAKMELVQDEFQRYKSRAQAALKRATLTGADDRSKDVRIGELEACVAEGAAKLSEALRAHELELQQAQSESERLQREVQRVKEECERKQELKHVEEVAALKEELSVAERHAVSLEDAMEQMSDDLAQARSGRERLQEEAQILRNRMQEQSEISSRMMSEVKRLQEELSVAPATVSRRSSEAQLQLQLSQGPALHPCSIAGSEGSGFDSPCRSMSVAAEEDADDSGLMVLQVQRNRERGASARSSAALTAMVEELGDANTRLSQLTAQEVVLKQTIRGLEQELERERALASGSNADTNVEYLKSAVFRYMVTHEVSEMRRLLPVVQTILSFTREEVKMVEERLASMETGLIRRGSAAVVGGLWSVLGGASDTVVQEDGQANPS